VGLCVRWGRLLLLSQEGEDIEPLVFPRTYARTLTLRTNALKQWKCVTRPGGVLTTAGYDSVVLQASVA
jgi:hypothetical protein